MQSACDWIGSCIRLIPHAADTGLELMAFRLRPDESVTHGLRRLARKELERARGELRKTNPPRDEAIHEARKSVKKVRAILQLIEDDEGNGVGGSGKRLHSVNRTLSGHRDADVIIETFARLRTRHPRLRSEEHTSELQSQFHLVCRLLLEKKK